MFWLDSILQALIMLVLIFSGSYIVDNYKKKKYVLVIIHIVGFLVLQTAFEMLN